LPDEEMKVLPLDETVSHLERVLNRTDAKQIAIEPHFFVQAPVRRSRDVLPGTWMTAARVRPETARVILHWRPLLKQQFVAVVEDEHRKGAVPPSMNVRLHFLGKPDAPILFIH